MPVQIGRYKDAVVINAKGGMGVIYKARDERLDRWVVIKKFRQNLGPIEEVRERFAREAKTQGALQHPNIAVIYEMGEHEGELFIVMEYVDGKTLQATLDALPGKRMKLDEALRLFEQLLDALECVHGRGIVHRDLKPLNIMVCDGSAKLIDFGLALFAGVSRLTEALKLLGTPPYMSPEQLEGSDIDHRSDIYSAALVLYRMLTGSEPFAATEYMARLYERMSGPPDPKRHVPEIPAGVCAVMAKAASYKKEERFRSAAAFRDALREGKEGFIGFAPEVVEEVDPQREIVTRPTISPGPEPQPKRAARWPYAAALCAIGAAAVFEMEKQPALVKPQPVLPGPVKPKPPVTTSSQVPPPVTKATVLPTPIAPPPPAPRLQETEEERTRRDRLEMNKLHEDLASRFRAVEADLADNEFASAIRELDEAAAIAAAHPLDLWQETDRVAQLRRLVRDRQREEDERAQQEAKWRSDLAAIEDEIRRLHYPEAEGRAQSLIDDPQTPDPIVDRARQLLKQAQDGLRELFQTTTVSPTTNAIRKPSSPPRNHR